MSKQREIHRCGLLTVQRYSKEQHSRESGRRPFGRAGATGSSTGLIAAQLVNYTEPSITRLVALVFGSYLLSGASPDWVEVYASTARNRNFPLRAWPEAENSGFVPNSR